MTINNLLVIGSTLVLVVSCWNRNTLPRDLDLQPEVATEPIQRATAKAPFRVLFDGNEYSVAPEFDYELNGLVVSFRHHDGNSRMHALAGDHLNMLDVCVVWGGNAASEFLHEFQYWNGIFTCNFSTASNAAWTAFDQTALSNNHLLSEDPSIRRQVRALRVGDQIRVRGLLASYASGTGSRRGTSTTRLDTGDGACETLYVESFETLRSAANPWRVSLRASLAVLVFAVLRHYLRPFRPQPALPERRVA